MKRLRVQAAQLLTRLARLFVPLCPGGCRQPLDRCTCSWLPPLPEEYPDD